MAARPLAVRLLQQRGVAHPLVGFDDTTRDASLVAAATGFPPSEVYKTLVVELDPLRGKPYLVLVPSDREIDLKALAVAIGAKKLRMASHRDAERHTGLRVGGISALALVERRFPVLIDERALTLNHVLVSAGERGLDIRLAVSDLIALTSARLVRTGEAGRAGEPPDRRPRLTR